MKNLTYNIIGWCAGLAIGITIVVSLNNILLSKKCLIVVLPLASLYNPNIIPKPIIDAIILKSNP